MNRQAARVLWLSLTTIGVSGCVGTSNQAHNPKLLDDKVTTQRVQAALAGGGPEFRGIDVQTTDGRVVLRGHVRSSLARQTAENLVRSVPRVTAVQDEIETQHP